MKKLEFETSKGRFVVLDVDYNSMTFVRILDTATACLGSEELFDYKKSFKLSEITEEQVSEILEEFHKNNFGTIKNPDYGFYDYNKNNFHLSSSIESLHSLFKSKDIHLFRNPLKDSELSFIGNVSGIDMLLAKQKHDRRIKEAEEKTFYNPYIFKL